MDNSGLVNLDEIDASKRDTLRKMILAAAFTVPVVSSFSVDAISMSRALAAVSNGNGNATSS